MKFSIGVCSFIGNTLLILLLCWAFIILYSEIVNEYQNKVVEKQINIEGVKVLSAKSDLTVSDVSNYDRQYGSNLYASLERPLVVLSGSKLSAQAKLQEMSSEELKTSLKNE